MSANVIPAPSSPPPPKPGAVRRRRAALWAPAFHSHWSHIRLIESDSGLCFLTNSICSRASLFTLSTLADRQTVRQTDVGEWCWAGCEAWNNGESSGGGSLLSCNEKQRQPLPWQLAGAHLQEDPDLPSATDYHLIVLGRLLRRGASGRIPRTERLTAGGETLCEIMAN